MPRATAVRILLIALAGGVLADIALPGNAAGLNVPILVLGLLAAALLVAGRDGIRRMDPADAWMAPGALVLAGMAAVRADPWLVQADIAFAAALTAGAIASLGGARITRGMVQMIASVVAGVLAAAFIGAAEVLAGVHRAPGGAAPAADADPGGTGGKQGRLRHAAPIARGIVAAVPFVLLFALLFASADAVFAESARRVLDWPLALDLADVAGRALVITIVAWGVAGLLALAGSRLPALVGARWPVHAMPMDLVAGAAGLTARTRVVRCGTIEATTVLVTLDALFAAFVALQLAYLFGGRDTLAAAGLTYAEYARRGFFELVAVAALAGVIVVVLDLAVGHRSRAQLAAAFGLLGLTAVVLVSALARLRLYQDAYGWTELRFVVLVAIGWLAAALAVAAVMLATRRTRWTLHVAGILTLVTIAGMSVLGPQSFVAERNLERAIDPRLVPPGGRSGLDADYLASLGDEAVPAVVAVIDRLPQPADRDALERFLRERSAALRDDRSLTGWPSWNIARERARTALAARAARATTATGPRLTIAEP